MRSVLVFCFGVSCLAFSACGESTAPYRPPDIVLISLDTLRADRVAAYGGERHVTPNIDQLAEQSALFELAYTQASHTLAAHASMLTGLYPERHGAVNDDDAIVPDAVTLAEILAGQGYQTGGFTNAIWLTPHFHIDRGFQTFNAERAALKNQRRTAGETNSAIFAWAESLGEAPYFLFAHYYDIHSDWDNLPYDAPSAFRKRFAGAAPPGFKAGEDDNWATSYLIRRILKDDFFGPVHLAYVRRLYDAGVAYTDSQVGRLLMGLKKRGRLDDAIIIITSDHGEEFQEHGMLLHSQAYEEQMRVPLLISFPEMRGRPAVACKTRPDGISPSRVPHVVQHVDLVPTLIECLGIDGPAGLQGESLLAAMDGGTVEREAAYFVSPHLYNEIASRLTGRRVPDLTSGFRAVRASMFKQFLYLLPNGFSYPTTITMAFLRSGYPVCFEPITAAERSGKSHIRPIRDGIRFLVIIFKIATLYSPLKIFMPISALFFATGLGYYAYTYFTEGRFTNMSMLVISASVIIFLIGLISEQITALTYSRS